MKLVSPLYYSVRCEDNADGAMHNVEYIPGRVYTAVPTQWYSSQRGFADCFSTIPFNKKGKRFFKVYLTEPMFLDDIYEDVHYSPYVKIIGELTWNEVLAIIASSSADVLRVAEKLDWILFNIPELLKTREVCMECVRREGLYLAHVPLPLKDEAMCVCAVENNGEAIQFVPQDHKSLELCRKAVEGSEWVVNLLPKNIRIELSE